eukprot:Gb_17656 [translate_table: standard]
MSANPFEFNVTLMTMNNTPNFNTQGLALALTDLDKGGFVPPHIHSKMSEITFIIKGHLLVGFVETSNKLFSQHLEVDDALVFPRA